VGRLIPAGTGLAYHETRKRQAAGIDAAPSEVVEAVESQPEEATGSTEVA
jgi:DNA-directed RNA polymerase subunit beta'